MNLRHLRFFIAVVECRGVSSAATRLRVSQPAVSAALRSLEDDLGLELFERRGGSRRTIPTFRGLRFYEHASEILGRYEEAKRSLRAPDEKLPVVRVGVLRTLAATDVAAVHASLTRRLPQMRWSLRDGSEHEILGWMNQGRIDIAWTLVEDTSETMSPLWREPYVVMVSRQHRLAGTSGGRVQVADIAQEPLVLRGTCELKHGALKAAGLSMKIAARTARDDLALQLVAKGIGIAVAPRSLATMGVVALPVADLGLSRQIGVRWRQGTPDATIEAVSAAVESRDS
ncbi:LysR family transcriptional regulator [Kaustia mangrovi]|uniref:LysR family transcriptional regulator n=1 Tax=Kaustia mangrovi TaxID=2593653 RepID=A0A7S8C3L8_9HYPH|nr:LysR family transcriptional regulator [Kaustia mangrovi]QPC42775.1 LysR family transcriptional regulator [Kaustia mangrovi]